ncbi:MAG TPA: 6-bladed beta-propeller [Longimicrobiaceae bacterium]|nr:6-bladed beta-propeller [Longimicrobiaceae bacterium]
MLEGDSERVFGAIMDVASDRFGNVYTLDPQVLRISVFDSLGNFLTSVGRAGRGPGEFLAPEALDVDSLNQLYVLDVSNQRVERYVLRGRSLVRTGAFNLPFAAKDLCALGNRLYLLGLHNGASVHQYTPDGRIVRSFGAVYGRGHTVLERSMARGYLACARQSGIVLLLPLMAGNVHAYSASGEFLWRARIPDYRPVMIRTRRDGGVEYRTRNGASHHLASSIVELYPSLALVQVGFLGQGVQARGDFARIDSYAVSLRNGRISKLSRPLPRVVSSMGKRALATQVNPYPKVTVYHIRERAR